MKIDLSKIITETRNPETMDLDTWSALEIVTKMNQEDAKVPAAIRPVLPKIAEIVEWAAESLRKGGRLIYIGAGTSGRLGVLDAAECPPTFGVAPGCVVGLIAGGETAFTKAVEGAEDNEVMAQQDLCGIGLTPNDLVIGIAASGRTPYVIGGLKYAKKVGCRCGVISCNPGSLLGKMADIAIEVVVGPEVLTGSTRLKAGTAQKLILNMISTAAMIKIGKVYQNLMVDVMQTNEKLHIRAENIVMEATGANREESRIVIERADGNVKVAIVMILLGCTLEEAKNRLQQSQGKVRAAISK